jgi:uncharacterized protein YlzI (FlbEa/FlbD family)
MDILIKVPGWNGNVFLINPSKIVTAGTVLDEVNVSDCINDIANGKQVDPKEYVRVDFDNGRVVELDMSIEELYDRIRKNS